MQDKGRNFQPGSQDVSKMQWNQGNENPHVWYQRLRRHQLLQWVLQIPYSQCELHLTELMFVWTMELQQARRNFASF